MFEDRRRAERLPVTIPIELNGRTGVTRDVSGLGVYFRAAFPFEQSEELEFLLRIPDAIHVRCWGRIVRVDFDREAMSYGVAVTIDDYDISDADQEDTAQPHIILRELRRHHDEPELKLAQ